MKSRKRARAAGRAARGRDGKTAAKTATSPLNGAQIPLGAHPGNSGGKKGRSGRPPSAIRERCRGSFDARVTVLEGIIDNMREDAADRIRAMELLARYGLGLQHSGPDGGPIPLGVVELPMLAEGAHGRA